MTTPTDAQIEAAIVAFCKSAGYKIEPRIVDGSQLRRDLVAALTAAAEVGPQFHNAVSVQLMSWMADRSYATGHGDTMRIAWINHRTLRTGGREFYWI